MIKPIKILSIEDDEFMRIFLKDIFWIHGSKSNIEFVSVENVKKAEEILEDKKFAPDLIFLDLVLPDKESGKAATMASAFQFLEKLKANPQTKDVKVIVFSGYSDREIKKRALSLGADKFLLKGEYLPHELINLVQEIS